MPITTMHPDDIRTHPLNVRRAVAVADLVESVRAQGVLQPLVLAPWPHDGADHELTIPQREDGTTPKKGTIDWPLVLIAGHRRLAAAREAGLDEVPVVVHTHLTTLADQLGVMLSENAQRTDLTPVEEADGVQALLDLDIKAGDVAKRIGRSAEWVRDRARIAKGPTSVREALTEGQLTLTDAAKLARFDNDKAAAARIEKDLARGPHNVGMILAREERIAAAEKERRKVLDAAKKAGHQVIEPATRWGVPDAAHPLWDLVDLTWAADLDDLTRENANTDQEAAEALAEAHQSCPGHTLVTIPFRNEPAFDWEASYTVDRDPEWWWACTNPADHHPDYEAPDAASEAAAPVMSEEENAARAEAERVDQEHADAAAARHAHIVEAMRDVLLGHRPMTKAEQDLVLEEARAHALGLLPREGNKASRYDRSRFASLGLDVPLGHVITDQDRRPARLRIEQAGLPELSLSALLESIATTSQVLCDQHAWTSPYIMGPSRRREVVDALTSTGYAWSSDVERDALARLAEQEASDDDA